MSAYLSYSARGGSGGGVTSLDGLTGALTLVAGTGISIADGVSSITISSTSAGDVTLTAVGSSPNANGASLSGQALTLQPANTSFPGVLLAADWNTFNNKQPAGSYITTLIGDGTAAGPGSAALTLATVNGNVGSFTNASVTVNAKGLITAASSGAAPEVPLTFSAPLVRTVNTISIPASTSSANGYLSSTDWSTFNSKQAAGNYITAITGDATASGPGSAALTLATVNSDVGSFGSASAVSAITVNAKGLVTAAASTVIQIAESQVTNLVSDLAAKQSTALTNAHLLVGNGSNVAADVAASGDLTLANTGAFTLNTVNGNVGSFGGATSVSAITVNAKGLITVAASTSIQIAESQVTNLVSDLAAKQSTTLTNAHILVGNGSNVAADVAASGDLTLSNAGAFTLNTVNGNVGSFTNASITVNAKGLITAASNGSAATAPKVTTYKTAGATGTHTFTGSPIYVEIEMCGAGGGGAGSGSSGAANGGNGTATTINSTVLVANGGSGATAQGATSTSGGTTTTTFSGTIGTLLSGGNGNAGSFQSGLSFLASGSGGMNPLGGAGGAVWGTTAGAGGTANTGAGGAGGGTNNASAYTGSGGGSGGYARVLISGSNLSGLSGSFSYAIGTGGSGGSAGVSGQAGGTAGEGYMKVTEYYQ